LAIVAVGYGITAANWCVNLVARATIWVTSITAIVLIAGKKATTKKEEN